MLVFVGVYLVSSILANDFYKIPVASAFIIAAIYALSTTKGKLSERITVFSKGAGNRNVMLMIWIFAMAGALAGIPVISVISHMYYPFILAGIAVLSILYGWIKAPRQAD